MKRSFSSQTLVHDGANAPQIGFGIIILWHDDLGSLGQDKHSWRFTGTVTRWRNGSENVISHVYHVHGRAAQRGSHHVCLEMPCKPKVSWKLKILKWRIFKNNLDQIYKSTTQLCILLAECLLWLVDLRLYLFWCWHWWNWTCAPLGGRVKYFGVSGLCEGCLCFAALSLPGQSVAGTLGSCPH